MKPKDRNAAGGKISFCPGDGESVQSNMGVVWGEKGGVIFGGNVKALFLVLLTAYLIVMGILSKTHVAFYLS